MIFFTCIENVYTFAPVQPTGQSFVYRVSPSTTSPIPNDFYVNILYRLTIQMLQYSISLTNILILTRLLSDVKVRNVCTHTLLTLLHSRSDECRRTDTNKTCMVGAYPHMLLFVITQCV